MLPAVVPALAYDDLDVADDDTALLLAPASMQTTRRRKLRAQLLAYCERDTLALVRLTIGCSGLARMARLEDQRTAATGASQRAAYVSSL